MKRLLIYCSLALLLGLFLAGGLALGWLLESPDGFRWLLRTVSRYTPVTVTARSVTGGLDSALRLEGLSARWPAGELTVADLSLRCQPLLIPFGSLAVEELSLRGVRFRDQSLPSSTGPELVWPRITGLPTMFDAWINRLRIEDFSYQNRNQLPITLPNVSASLVWRDSRLNVSNLSIATARGRVAGTFTTGFSSASLVCALAFEPLQPLADCSRFELRTRLLPGQSPEQMTGEIVATALTGNQTRYTMNGTVGLTRKELHLHGLSLTEQGRPGSLDVAGTLLLNGEAQLHLRAAALDLTSKPGEKMALAGTLDLNGGIEHYAGRFNLSTNGQGWRKTRLAGNFLGGTAGADLTGISAAILNGTISGNVRVNWRDELTVKGSLHGQGLDPADLDPAWNGVINFDLDSKATWAGGRLRQAEVQGRLLKSRLRGKVLSGEVAAMLKDDDLRIDRLFLAGDGVDIHAAGILSQRLDMTANISKLSGLIPQTKGTLALKGWGRYAAGIASGAISGSGHDLAAKGVQITSVSLNASLADGPERSLSAAAELNGVRYHGLGADNASLKADGSLNRHRLVMALRSAGAEIMGQVSGGYAEGSWQGELTHLSGHDLVGPWQLVAPASLTISPQAVTITSLVLTGSPSERVELTGRLLLNPLRGTAQTAWSGLNLARADQWLVDTRLVGQSSGNLLFRMPTSDRLTLQGKASATGMVTLGNRTITLNKALLDLDAGDRGITASLEFRTGEGISVNSTFTSPDPATLAIPSHGQLHASWEGIDPTLAKRWLPQGLDLQGRLSGELSGDFLPERRFASKGTLSLADGEGRWCDEERKLTASVRNAGITWNWSGDSLQVELLLSLTTLGEARGTFQLPLPARFDTVPDPTGQVRGTFSGSLQENGIITTFFPDLLQETKGLLEFNLRAGGTWQTATVTGTVGLEQAGAYLPTAGIRLADFRLTANLAGQSLRNLRLDVPVGDRLNLEVTAASSGTVTLGNQTVTIQKALIDLGANDKGTTARLEVQTDEGISVSGQFTSPDPATLTLPSHGEVNAVWKGLDAALARHWLPKGVDLQGRLSGELSGKLFPEQRFHLNGTITLVDGGGRWRDEERELAAAVRTSALTWNWRDDSLSGALSLSLTNFGEARGSFQLPLPARFGAVPDPAGQVRGTLSGRFNEKGILSSLFPGILQETKGLLEVDLLAGGTWQAPTVTGTLELTQAGAYIPSAGIHLTDIRLAASLEGTQMQIKSFRVASGTGAVEGTADLSFAGRKLAGYHGTLHGESFQAVNFPELQLMVAPNLTFEGNLEKFSASGLIRIPEMQVNRLSSSTVIKPSADVVILGRESARPKPAGLALDLQLRLLLGDQVVIKTEELDARLEGEIDLRMTSLAAGTGRGEIRVAKGSYHIYGVNLDIKRGRAIFSGGPIERPTLDILALRKVDDVKAGVTITGSPEVPLIKLYSEPALPDTDILAYIVLGHKLGESGQQTALLMQAASLLVSPKQSAGLQGQLKQMVNLDTIAFTSGKDRSPGYKPIESSLRTTSQSKTESNGVSQTMFQLGKYLTPELYVSYGRSLFDESQQLRTRYTISKHWEVESKVSPEATGGDLYYRIELD